MITLADVQRILSAKVLQGEGNLDKGVAAGCACDLMSDVLAYAREKAVILTGLVNEQVIHTAEMVDAVAVVFVRGKTSQVSQRLLSIAKESGMTVMVTDHLLFESCGLLYSAGLRSCNEGVRGHCLSS